MQHIFCSNLPGSIFKDRGLMKKDPFSDMEKPGFVILCLPAFHNTRYYFALFIKIKKTLEYLHTDRKCLWTFDLDRNQSLRRGVQSENKLAGLRHGSHAYKKYKGTNEANNNFVAHSWNTVVPITHNIPPFLTV